MIISVLNDGNVKTKEYFVNGEQSLAHLITKYDYSLISYEENYRAAKNFKKAELVGLDFDDGMSIAEAKKSFKDYKHVIATTKSHGKKKNGKYADRFRVILYLNKPITNRYVYTATVKDLMKRYPQADVKCSDAARFFYKSKAIVSLNTKGKLVEAIPAVKVLKAPIQKEVNYSKKPLGFTNCMWSIANGNFGQGDRNEALMGLTSNLKGMGYNKEQAYYFCKHACEQRGETYDKDELWNTIINYIYSREFGTAKYNCEAEGNWLHDYCNNLGDNGCANDDDGFKVQKLSEFWKEDYKVEWFVQDLLTKGAVSIFSGPPKSGKSTLVRQLIKNTVNGGVFLGRKVEKGRVLYLALEEAGGMLKHQLSKVGMNGNEDVFISVGKPASRNVIQGLGKVINKLNPQLVVVDTLGHIFGAEDFNNYAEVNNLFTDYREIARRTNSHIMFIHHTNKIGGTLGSTAFDGGTDCNISLSKTNSERRITTSQRGGKPFLSRELKFDQDTETYSLGSKKEVKTEEF